MTRVNSGPARVDPSLGSCDFFVSCDSVVPLKRDSNHLSSLPGIPLPLHAGLFSIVPAGTWPRRQHEIVSGLSIAVDKQIDRPFRFKLSARMTEDKRCRD